MKTIEGFAAKPSAFPQCCKARAKEKGRVWGCLQESQAHTFLKPFSSQLSAHRKTTFLERGKLISRTSSPSGHHILWSRGCSCLQPSAWHRPFLCLPKARAPGLPSSPPSHSLEPVGKEVFSLPWKRTDN